MTNQPHSDGEEPEMMMVVVMVMMVMVLALVPWCAEMRLAPKLSLNAKTHLR